MKIIIFALFLNFSMAFINSCGLLEPKDSKPIDDVVLEINVISKDGSGFKTIAEGWDIKPLKNNQILVRNGDNLNYFSIDGTKLATITCPYSLWEYNISSNGEEILLSLFRDQKASIYSVNSKSSDIVQLSNESNQFDLDASFSSDNQQIVFRRSWNICTMNQSGDNLKTIKSQNDSLGFRKPLFIQGNSKIIFVEQHLSSFSEFTKLHLLDIETSVDSIILEYRRNTFYFPSLEIINDNKLLFIERNDGLGEDEIKLLDFTNNKITILAPGYFCSSTNNGTQVIYNDLNKIYIIDCDGSNKKVLPIEDNIDRSIGKVFISSDNKTVIFESERKVPFKSAQQTNHSTRTPLSLGGNL